MGPFETDSEFDTHMANLALPIVGLLVLLGCVFGSFPRTVNPARNKGHKNVSVMGAFLEKVGEAKRHLVSAAFARSVSILGMYPLDTIKTRIQIDAPNPFRLSGLYGKYRET